MSGVAVQANIGSASHLLHSSNGFPPGYLSTDGIDTSTATFASMTTGKLRGNISAASLAATPLPSAFSSTDQGYTSTNSLLDVFVNGASIGFGLITLINPIQPDQSDPSMPVAGAGPPYKLLPDPATKIVTKCLDKNNDTVDLATALNSAAYSFYVTFTTDRVIVRQPISISLSVSPRWNLISIPVAAADLSKQHLFPAASSAALLYNGSYVPEDTLRLGVGYWLEFDSAAYLSWLGSRVVADTVAVAPNWNIVGGPSVAISVSSVTSDSPGVVLSQFFGFNGSYSITDSLYPGRGYWVKANKPCNLLLSSLGGGAASQRNEVTITPAAEQPPASPGGSIDAAPNHLPDDYALDQAYPNPFNPATTIQYRLPADSRVSLKVYDVLGQLVATLQEGIEVAGYKEARWNAPLLSSGVYFYRLEATSLADPAKIFTSMKKMMLLK